MAIKRLFPGVKLLHHSIYTEYRKYDKIAKTKKVKGREELRNVMDVICKHIGKGIVESPGGVLVDNLGYFFVWKVPRKGTYFMRTTDKEKQENYNFHTDHHLYLPTFVPTKPKISVIQGWGMDKTFHEEVKQGIASKLRGGETYRMYAHSIKQI